MFWHNFKYTFKTLLKNKALIFWTFAFPLILGTLFYLAFSDIEKNEKLEIFSIAVVKESENEILEKALESLSIGEDKIFDMEYKTLEEANNLLNNKEIVGYIRIIENPEVIVSKNGIEETVLKTTTETILEEISLSKTLFEAKQKEGSDSMNDNLVLIEKIKKEVEETLKKNETSIQDNSPKNLSYTMIEFYSLIAMTCLYGGMLTMVSINKNLANMCSTGKRISVTPTPKFRLILSSVLASFILELIGLSILFLYTIFILHIDYGNKISFILMLSFTGSLAGVSLGSAIATLFKTNENMKTGLLLAITMTGSFFAGMMGITMKYIIDQNIPILNIINPVNMITDGLYTLYYYDTNTKFFFNMTSLLIFSSILIFLSIKELRRQSYDSI